MRIWSIQTAAAWTSLEKHGVLRATREHQDNNWPDAYAWMTGQVTKRVGEPPHENAAPLWGWYHYMGANKKRPDLRRIRHHWGDGKFVMIECELPDDKVVLSDFDAWHHALNGQYLELTAEELESYGTDRMQYEAAPTKELHDNLYQRFYASWERIIDMHQLTEPDWAAMDKKIIQACFWELRAEDIKTVRPFEAVLPKRRRAYHSALSVIGSN